MKAPKGTADYTFPDPATEKLSDDALAQEKADAATGKEIHRGEPKSKAPAPKPKAPAPKPKKMASGGYVSKADGCTQSGKTKGRFV
jgi:hypothetical protein